MSTTKKQLCTSKLATSKEYREAFVAAFVKRYIPFQIRTLRKNKEISQQKLAEASNVTQGVISRAEDADYGNLTFNTVLRIAAGFDLAFVGKFVRFSELLKIADEMSEVAFDLPDFSEECRQEETYAIGASLGIPRSLVGLAQGEYDRDHFFMVEAVNAVERYAALSRTGLTPRELALGGLVSPAGIARFAAAQSSEPAAMTSEYPQPTRAPAKPYAKPNKRMGRFRHNAVIRPAA